MGCEGHRERPKIAEDQAAMAFAREEKQHELDDDKYHIAQIIWGADSRKASLYKFCLEHHVTNDPSEPDCNKLEKAIQRAIDKK
jgi:hypothetical protein